MSTANLFNLKLWRISQNARNIHAESVSIRKFVHKCTKFGCTRHSWNKFRSALVGTNSLTATLQQSRCRGSVTFSIRGFFRSDVECIEGICAVGAVFERVFFGLRLLLHRLVLAEAVVSRRICNPALKMS